MSEEDGAKMIIALQALAGIEEPKERALKAWREFSDDKKQSTINAHRALIGHCPKVEEETHD